MREWSILPIRIALAAVFIAHGLQKAFGLFGGSGIEGFAGMLSGMGFSPANLWAYLVAGVELIGGLCILIGLFARISAGLIFIVMAVAVFKVHLANGFFLSEGGIEYALVLMLMCLSLMISGSGKLSINKKL